MKADKAIFLPEIFQIKKVCHRGTEAQGTFKGSGTYCLHATISNQ
jgi:hypothetical protein